MKSNKWCDVGHKGLGQFGSVKLPLISEKASISEIYFRNLGQFETFRGSFGAVWFEVFPLVRGFWGSLGSYSPLTRARG